MRGRNREKGGKKEGHEGRKGGRERDSEGRRKGEGNTESLLIKNNTNNENTSDNSQVVELTLLHVVQPHISYTGDENSDELIRMTKSRLN